MKVIKISFLFLAIACLNIACSKSETEELQTVTTDLQITNDEAVEIIEGALADNSQGISNEAAEVAEITENVSNFTNNTGATARNNDNCGILQDTAYTFSKEETNFKANYEVSLSYTINCNQRDLPQSVDYQRDTKGSYETKRLISDDNTKSTWHVDNVLSGAEYVFSGNYERTGKQTSKVFNKKEYNSTLTMELNSLKVDKGKQKITSGQATFTMKGSDGAGKNFEFKGEIVFTGNQTATLVLNGETYTIDW